jgi:hypothetical protein
LYFRTSKASKVSTERHGRGEILKAPPLSALKLAAKLRGKKKGKKNKKSSKVLKASPLSALKFAAQLQQKKKKKTKAPPQLQALSRLPHSGKQRVVRP